ncbi:MAG: caspase domain-containing protein [Pirellulales bacterium]
MTTAILRNVLLGCLVLTCGLAAGQEPAASEGEPAVRGDRRVTNVAVTQPKQYRQRWALVIGINDYTHPMRSDAESVFLRTLNHAEQDAAEVHKLLLEHYGYDAEHAFLLLGANATHQAILDQLTAFLDETKVDRDDSILVYFAGHGARIEGDMAERGALYPVDVQLAAGRPLGRYVGLNGDLLGKLKRSPARHKLIVLDSCHSGEIFSLQARPRSETDNRQQPQLFAQPALQAIASCRATQLASDGRDGHSPFTGALLHAMTQLPAREPESHKSPLWANKLFAYMRSELTSLPDGQSPDCRSLSEDDGEFYLFPQGDFSGYSSHQTEYLLLQAMVPSEHGNWWFEETPWFIPSLRRMVLDDLRSIEQDRSTAQSLAISTDMLRELTDRAILKMRGSTDPLVKMRLRHLESLLRGQTRSELQNRVKEIIAELTPLSTGEDSTLEATDLHLLAVAQNSLGEEQAGETYRMALNAYRGDDGSQRTLREDALMALCHADLGYFLLNNKADCLGAAREYQAALSPFGASAPGAFRVYVLACEADAWQRLNRWGEANRKLLTALDVANNFDAEHGLTAFVWRRRAWAFMEQWRIAEAATAFEKANDILLRRAQATAEGDAGGGSTATIPAEEALVLAGDFDAQIAYLHDLHGLAMVKRFEGDGVGATRDYRRLTGKIAAALSLVRQQSQGAKTASDVELRLIERLINTEERLGDCNLFGNPATCDIKEAIDDYRRALGVCHLVPAYRRDRTRMGLLFKQALAYSATSSVQDLDLARATCHEATAIFTRLEASSSEVLRTLAMITPAVVELMGEQPQNEGPLRQSPLAELRMVIQEVRDHGGSNLHRDQLEVLLFASKTLADKTPAEDRYHLVADAELLLSFCRQVLPKQSGAKSLANEERQETRQYLRPYYDAVMRNKLRLMPRQVKDLLEIQWEATRGEFYLKQPEASPVLAMYLLDGQCYLFFDVPRGASKSFSFEEDLDRQTLIDSCSNAAPKLALPREVLRELERLRDDAASSRSLATAPIEIDCWWQDPLQGIGQAEFQSPYSDDPQRVTTLRPSAPGEFPFQLPSYVRNRGERQPAADTPATAGN